jgi:hypothetical protein
LRQTSAKRPNVWCETAEREAAERAYADYERAQREGGMVPEVFFQAFLAVLLRANSRRPAPIDVLDLEDFNDPGQEEVGGRAPAFGLALEP